MSPKKKPSKTRGTPAQFVPGLMRDARASVSLDGETQHCWMCDVHPRLTAHTCHLRPMTAEERAVVEVCLSHPHEFSECVQLREAIRALRAARGK